MSHKLLTELLSQSPSPEFTLVIQALWQVWKTIEIQIKKIEQKLKELALVDANEPIYRGSPRHWSDSGQSSLGGIGQSYSI